MNAAYLLPSDVQFGKTCIANKMEMPVEDLNGRPDLLVEVSGRLPEDFALEVLDTLRSTGATAGEIRMERGPYAGMELYLPTMVGLFIVSSFFDGFFSNMGEGASEALKKGAKALYRKARPINSTMIGSAGKVKDAGYSFDFAIGCDLAPSLRVKLLIRKDAAPEVVEVSIEAFLDLMILIHAGKITTAELGNLLTYQPVAGTVLMTYDAERAEIVAVDGLADTPMAGRLWQEPSVD